MYHLIKEIKLQKIYEDISNVLQVFVSKNADIIGFSDVKRLLASPNY